MKLSFRSHLGENFTVKIYSLFAPVDVLVNERKEEGSWKYDQKRDGLRSNLPEMK
jgi:hypothetical protein